MADASFEPDSSRKKRTVLGLALALETACRDFELMLRMQKREIWPVSASGEDYDASAAIMMALAKSFVFNAARAARICEEGAGVLNVSREERRAFVSGLQQLRLIRDVNEHGFDPNEHSRRKNARPKSHLHELEEAAVDETSLAILSSDTVLMGPINLCDAYPVVERMRKVAGFSAIPLD